jgi:hypothetical protein
MQSRASARAVALLVLTSLTAIACDDADDPADASVTGPSRFVVGSTITADPPNVSAQFQGGSGCLGEIPFDARIDVNVRPQEDLFIQTIGFEFVPAFGRRVFPVVVPGTFELNNSVLPPIPLPTSHPIPFPGQVPMSNIVVPAGAFLKAPFRLQFACGVPARGTLFVAVETADRRGTAGVSRTSAQIGH